MVDVWLEFDFISQTKQTKPHLGRICPHDQSDLGPDMGLYIQTQRFTGTYIRKTKFYLIGILITK